MKFTANFLTFLLIASFSISTANVSAAPRTNSKINNNTISSLMNGLKSENLGLKTGCAYMIGELQISNAIIPLMKILREDKNEEVRIAAALALYKIGSPMAINAVKQSIRFDDSERVSKLCANFYNEYLKNKNNDEEKNDAIAKVAIK
jgi:HEAT repeat protein